MTEELPFRARITALADELCEAFDELVGDARDCPAYVWWTLRGAESIIQIAAAVARDYAGRPEGE